MGKLPKQKKANRSNLINYFKQRTQKTRAPLVSFISPEIIADNKSDPDFEFIEKEIYELKEVGTDLISDIVEFIMDNGYSHRTIGILILAILK
jgi:hypothetical protein